MRKINTLTTSHVILQMNKTGEPNHEPENYGTVLRYVSTMRLTTVSELWTENNIRIPVIIFG